MHSLVRGALSVFALLAALNSAVAQQASDPTKAPLRPGDRLLIKAWLDTAFADSVRINENGNAILPRLGATLVTEVPASDVAELVRSAYAKVIRTPAIEVTPLRRVVILGEVRRPATYFMETSSTLREAIALALGVTDNGTLGHIVILRGPNRIEIDHWEQRYDPELIVHSGDVVWVDRESWIKRNIFSVVSGLGVLFSVFYYATH